MKLLIILFGLLIVAMAGFMLVRPREMTGYLLEHAGETWLHILAAGVRIIMGIALILYAGNSRFPMILHVIGWIALVAGIALALVPPSKFKRLMEWAFERFGPYIRLAGSLAILFGAFLIYAVL